MITVLHIAQYYVVLYFQYVIDTSVITQAKWLAV